MDFDLNEEQTAIADLADSILGDASDPAALRALETSGAPRFNRDLWATLAEAGILGAFVPESAGGSGLDIVAMGAVLDRAGRHWAAVPLWETLAGGVLALTVDGADADVAAPWLAKVAAGDAVLSAAWHEPTGEPLAPFTTAVASGDGVAVTGEKVPVPAGQIADAVVVPCRVDGEIALVLVETGASGVTVEPVVSTAATPDALIRFESAPAKVIARGDAAVMAAFERATATQCAVMAGLCESALRLTADYTKERKQFDTPIATFQAVAHRAADAFINTEGVRLTAYQALWRLADGRPASAEVALAKVWAADGAHKVVLAAQHLHGGVGVDRDYPVHRSYVMTKQAELFLGGATESLLRLGSLIAAGEA